MNQRKIEKEFRENVTAIGNFIRENNGYMYQQENYASSTKLFYATLMTWRRKRCGNCKKLIDIGECYVYPNYKFFGNYARECDLHLKCFYNQIKKDIDGLENWVKFISINTKDQDFSIKELEN